MDFDFKVPSVVPQDLLLIQDLIGALPAPTTTTKRAPDSSDSGISSSDDEGESEDEVEAGLVPRDEDSGASAAASDSPSRSDPESDSSSSDSEEGHDHAAPQHRPAVDVEDEESGMTTTATYLQTKNEVVDPNIIVPALDEVDPSDTLEKVGEIMSIVGDIVIVRGLAANHIKSLSKRALDAESLLVFEDRKVLGYVYETFGPTSQPLYQVKFNQHYPLDTNKVWLSREVFHVPRRSHFVFVDQLKNLRGSDASNIHDEEPADDEVEFSDDEKEAAFKAQRKRRRGHSTPSSRQSTPALSRLHADDVVQDTYHGSNPYDAHGPYDDDYHITGPSRPSLVLYDDPYADVPTSDVLVHPLGTNDGSEEVPDYEGSRDGPEMSRRHMFSRSARGSRARSGQLRNATRRGHRHNPTASRRTFDSGTDQPSAGTSQVAESVTEYGYSGGARSPQPLVQAPLNAWLSSETNNIPDYRQPFVQPHINPRFASLFGLNLPSGTMVPWASQNAHGHASRPQHFDDMWTMHGGTGSDGEGDTYRPM